jgi:uncharacterized membrane protein
LNFKKAEYYDQTLLKILNINRYPWLYLLNLPAPHEGLGCKVMGRISPCFYGSLFMKILIWAITAVVALLGTVLVAVMASAVGWLGDNMAGGADWVKQLAQVPVPVWLSSFLDPAMVEWVRTASVGVISAVAAGLPWLAPLLAWVAPVLWVIWLILLICLMGLAGGLHYAVGRRRSQARSNG